MVKSRIFIVLFFVGLLWSVMALRGAYLQLLPNEQFEKIKNRQFNKVVKLSSRRGDILDRNGKELAISVTTQSLFADPSLIQDPYSVAKRVSHYLKIPFQPLHKKLKNKKNRFVWIQRRLENDQFEKIQSWKIKGLAFKEEYKRVYPNKTLASQVLGFVGREQQGLAGLELLFDKTLTGSGKDFTVQRDARGRPLLQDGRLFATPPEGSDIFLTIDKDLQYWVELQLQNAVKDNEAEAAWAVVLNPSNSEILAMASYPFYDSNEPLKTPAQNRRNRAIQDVYETGSVMKAVSIGGALEKGVVEPNTKINTENGVFKIGKRTITEADKDHSFPELTVSEILIYSSNVGTSKIALKMRDQALYQTLKDFGFAKKTGVTLPGEEGGLLTRPPWRDHLTANISFGHGVAVTALQVANAYAAIANGGELNQPTLIKEVRDLENGEIQTQPKKTMGRIISPKNSHLLKMMLSSVVAEGGSGYRARIDGFPVAGKTGTAQKVNPNGRGYLPGHYISNFAGFVPANDPRYVIYVAVDSPMKKGYYASTVAAPIFRSIAEFALRRDRRNPVYVSDADWVKQTQWEEEESEKKIERKNITELKPEIPHWKEMPPLRGLTLKEVLQNLRGQDIKVKMVGKGRVERTYPEEGRPLTREIQIYFKENETL